MVTERGLVDAVRVLAMDSPLEAAVSAGVVPRLDAPIESAVHFGVAELLTNALKHAQATRARISITRTSPSSTSACRPLSRTKDCGRCRPPAAKCPDRRS
ncbi:hypothetical protein [Nonomuraea aridisoli]|uniref:hypothetical protein n=1 Tax=Nonomuraea aridisoli TaxID=2070368 RepID=UPI001C65190E|nr:hypothetical protein [Nonomuraea aridisoli]